MLYQACKSDPLNMVPLWRIHLQVLLYLSLFCSKSLEHIALQNKKKHNLCYGTKLCNNEVCGQVSQGTLAGLQGLNQVKHSQMITFIN